jgi:hypothetical protein
MSPMGFSPAYQHNVYGNLPSRNTNQMVCNHDYIYSSTVRTKVSVQSGRAGMVSGGLNDVNNSTQSGSHLSHHRPPEGNMFILSYLIDIS